MADFTTTWKTAKKAYEDKTMEKKPSKTFLGIRAGAGIEGPLSVIDKVKQPEPVAKAIAIFKKSAIAFEKLLLIRVREHQGTPQFAVLKTEGEKLLKVLEKLRADVEVRGLHVIEEACQVQNALIDKQWVATTISSDLNKLKILRVYAAKEFSAENVDFMVALRKKAPEKELFEKFISKKAKTEVNLPNAVRAKICTPDGSALKPKVDWVPVIKAAEDNLEDILGRFRPQAMADYREAVTASFNKLSA